MQNKPELKSTGLLPPEEPQEGTSVHVFGMNLEDRVVNSGEASEYSLSFTTSVPNKSLAEEDDDNIESIRKRKFEAITGEEDESTIFQGDFKLFVWDLQTSNWLEKGRGQLKLNDSVDDGEEKKSRLIMRVNGTLRIILNIAIHPTFRILASSKNNIRFTDSQTVWAASGSYASQLNDFIEERLKRMRKQEKKNDTKKKPIVVTSPASDDDSPPKKTKSETPDMPSTSKLSTSSDTKDTTPVSGESGSESESGLESDPKSKSESESEIEKEKEKEEHEDEKSREKKTVDDKKKSVALDESKTTQDKSETCTKSDNADKLEDRSKSIEENEKKEDETSDETKHKDQAKDEKKLDTQENHDNTNGSLSSKKDSSQVVSGGDEDKNE